MVRDLFFCSSRHVAGRQCGSVAVLRHAGGIDGKRPPRFDSSQNTPLLSHTRSVCLSCWKIACCVMLSLNTILIIVRPPYSHTMLFLQNISKSE